MTVLPVYLQMAHFSDYCLCLTLIFDLFTQIYMTLFYSVTVSERRHRRFYMSRPCTSNAATGTTGNNLLAGKTSELNYPGMRTGREVQSEEERQQLAILLFRHQRSQFPAGTP